MSGRRGAALVVALAAGVLLGLGVHMLGAETRRTEQLLQNLFGGTMLALVLWIALLTLRRSRP